MSKYKIIDIGDKRILAIGDNKYETIYSKRIIELIISRKGFERVSEYLLHKDKRSHFFTPLFDYLRSKNFKGLNVLEVGCSAGQFTELLNAQPSIRSIYCFDVDKTLIEVTKIKTLSWIW